jgi:hypothetical protein
MTWSKRLDERKRDDRRLLRPEYSNVDLHQVGTSTSPREYFLARCYLAIVCRQ